ncbi:MAG TPA: hypothetical protein DDW20_04455 [Firmicutes bacterium]|nr:hypothetical protein [Bacillota bacterium]
MDHIVVVAPRDKKAVLALTVIIFGFIIFIGFALLATLIFCDVINVSDGSNASIIILSIFSILVCCFSLPVTIFNLVNFIFNKKMKDKPCLEFNTKTNEFIAHSVWNKDFIIKSGNIDDITSASWLYSHETKLSIKNEDGTVSRINLGFSTYHKSDKLRSEINNYQKNAI